MGSHCTSLNVGWHGLWHLFVGQIGVGRDLRQEDQLGSYYNHPTDLYAVPHIQLYLSGRYSFARAVSNALNALLIHLCLLEFPASFKPSLKLCLLNEAFSFLSPSPLQDCYVSTLYVFYIVQAKTMRVWTRVVAGQVVSASPYMKVKVHHEHDIMESSNGLKERRTEFNI